MPGKEYQSSLSVPFLVAVNAALATPLVSYLHRLAARAFVGPPLFVHPRCYRPPSHPTSAKKSYVGCQLKTVRAVGFTVTPKMFAFTCVCLSHPATFGKRVSSVLFVASRTNAAEQ